MKETFRDDAAIAAMQGLLAGEILADGTIVFDDVARWSYGLADALVKEREKGERDGTR